MLLVCPPVDLDTAPLPFEPAIFHDTQPAHDRFASRHTMREAIGGAAGTVVVSLPRARQAARDRIARALRLGCPVLVDGQKTDGVDAVLKEVRRRGRVGPVISKAHGKIFVVEAADLEEWVAEPVRNAAGWLVPPGGFSADGIDPGSAALLGALPPLAGRVVDLGAGWGALAAAVLGGDAVTRCDLVEAHRPSLDCARANVADPRAAFHWADATAWRPEAPADHVVTNPPFHRGRTADPDLGRAFIATAAAALGTRGTLWVAANRHLPYESTLDSLFAEVEERPGTTSYKIHRAARPRRRR